MRALCARVARAGRVPPYRRAMTILWFIAWLITTLFITDAPLTFDPVNWWAGLLLAAVALDLAGAQAKNFTR